MVGVGLGLAATVTVTEGDGTGVGVERGNVLADPPLELQAAPAAKSIAPSAKRDEARIERTKTSSGEGMLRG
jgi:hypothetical protein